MVKPVPDQVWEDFRHWWYKEKGYQVLGMRKIELDAFLEWLELKKK